MGEILDDIMSIALEKYCSPHGKPNPETYAFIEGCKLSMQQIEGIRKLENEAAYWKALAIATDNAYISYRKWVVLDGPRDDPEGTGMNAAKAYEQYSIDRDKYEQLKK